MAASSSSTDATESTARKSPKDAVSNIPSFISTLPSDIHEEFIARLPLRSLIISSSVCKSWYALLKNPYFASKHFQHTTAHTYFLSRHCQSAHGNVSIVSTTESFDNTINIFKNIPFLEKSKLGLRISGSCNGLVCLSEQLKASIIILRNPITRVFKAPPVSTVKRPDFSPCYVILGFGFDPIANDFILLYKGSLFYRESMVVVNGRFHWKACEIVNERYLTVTFDVSKEVFTHIQLPNLFGIHTGEYDIRKLGWELVVWKEDLLGMIIYPNTYRGRYFDMWVLDEYGVENSWSKHFTFGQDTDVHKPLACKSNGEILLYKKNGQLVVYDSAMRTFNVVPVQGIPFHGEVFNYVGSLLPIEGGSTIEVENLAAVEPDPFFEPDF